ncbi:MAG: TonB-dependent receptor plug domain-containing protein [Saprospiraceae bacterium]|nr:TonB-dependent receptor plug domain-containing protein [Saprospiraceae bacterium]
MRAPHWLRSYPVMVLALLTITWLSCSTSAPAGNVDKDKDIESPEFTELMDLLRREGGLDIRGYGSDASIFIRGNRSLSSSDADQPLFVVDGAPIGRGYAEVEGSVDVQTVKKITVVPPAQAGRYGARGAFGVIEITTK